MGDSAQKGTDLLLKNMTRQAQSYYLSQILLPLNRLQPSF